MGRTVLPTGWSSLGVFFFNDTATTEIYTLSLHDALPIFDDGGVRGWWEREERLLALDELLAMRSEEHTSELQSHSDLVCRLLLDNKNDMHFVIGAGMGDPGQNTAGGKVRGG